MASSWLKEMGIAFGVVGALLLGLTLYTSVWPPLVVVESGSMMHPQEESFGNLGTIDPGDLVLVKEVNGREDVSLFVGEGEGHYGRAGDVIVYYPNNDRRRTPIIHRAMTWVTVPENGPCTYQWFDGQTRQCDPDGTLTIERWGIEDWRPEHSGFITLGDNNEQADQATGRVGGAVRMDWVQGKARGEIPWIGLIKLAVSPGPNQFNAPADWTRVGNAYAPTDLWIMLAVSLGGLFVAPMALEAGLGVAVREYRRREGPDEPGPPPNPGDGPPGGEAGAANPSQGSEGTASDEPDEADDAGGDGP